MVAIYQSEVYETVKRLPIIGKIVDLTVDDNGTKWVQFSLWNGSYSGKWSCPNNPRLEWVSVDAVILFDFKLTDKGHLHGATREQLKRTYSTLIDDSN